MPKIKLSKADKKKLLFVKERCPCITSTLLAYIFDLSPSRVSEILREEDKKEHK